MSVRKYHHTYCRVEYPLERGYRMEVKPLPDWIHITVSDNEDSKELTVHSRIHVNKSVKVGPSYSKEFSDTEIIKDLSGEIFSRFIK